jgi:hypothetical protein
MLDFITVAYSFMSRKKRRGSSNSDSSLNEEARVRVIKDQFKIQVVFQSHLADFPEICFIFLVSSSA